MTDTTNEASPVPMRVDRWLWAARFFKTRSLAAEAIDRGRVDVNGQRAKRATGVSPGQEVTVRNPPYSTTVVVRAVAEHRGPAKVAALLYDETPESRAARERTRASVASLPLRDRGAGKPSKKDRRELRRLRGDEE